MRDRLDDSRQECGQLSAELASKVNYRFNTLANHHFGLMSVSTNFKVSV